MKKLTNSKLILYALIILLVVTNLVTAITVLRYINNPDNNSSTSVSKEEMPVYQRTKFFSDELNLDEDQQYVFRELNRTYNQSVNHIYSDLSHLRLDLVDEMGLTKPDTLKLQTLSREIGDLHTQLKNLTISFYLGMKAVCTPEQQDLLFMLFKSNLNTEEDLNTPRGKRSGRGYGRRQQNNN